MSNQTKILIHGGGFGEVYTALQLDKTLARPADTFLVAGDDLLEGP